MKKNYLTKLLVVAFLICVCTLYTSLSHAGTITDDFSGASINTQLWTPFNDSQYQSVAQQDGKLIIHIDRASSGGEFGAGLQSNFLLKGDFTVTVDYYLTTWPEANGVALGFEGPNTLPDANAQFMIKRRSLSGGGEIYSADFKDGTDWFGNGVPTSGTSGRLELTRVGSVLTGYFSPAQTNNWQQIGSHNYSALDEGVAITLWANSTTGNFLGQDVEIAFDNFNLTYSEIQYTPIPGTLLLLGSGLLGLAGVGRKLRKS